MGRNVLSGSRFQSSPISSTLNTCRAVWPPYWMTLHSSAGFLHAASTLAPGASLLTPGRAGRGAP